MKKIVALILLIADICLLILIINGYEEHKTEETIRNELRQSTELYNKMKNEKNEERSDKGQSFSEAGLLYTPAQESKTERIEFGMEEAEPFVVPEEELPFDIARAEVRQ